MKNKEIRPELEQMLRDIENPLFSGDITSSATTAASVTGPPLTLADLTRSIQKLKEGLHEVPRERHYEHIHDKLNFHETVLPQGQETLFGMLPIRTCNFLVPVRSLKNKKWHTCKGRVRNYVRRVNKKWLKRFGQRPFLGRNEFLVVDTSKLELRMYGGSGADFDFGFRPPRTRPAILMRSDTFADVEKSLKAKK